MEWTSAHLDKLESLFKEKYREMFSVDSSKTSWDRKNRSAVWNKYLKNYDAKLIRNDVPGKKTAALRSNEIVIKNLIDLINFKNDVVTNGVVLSNPDRYGQYLCLPRDIAERILVFGMI